MDYLKLYDLESYLLDSVRARFHEQGYLSAFDFFCIIIWKSNRAKSKIARRMLANSKATDLETAVRELTRGLYDQSDEKERMRYLIERWGFLLPMTSAILTVLYPDAFTVYDYRVCNYLNDFHKIANRTNFEKIWGGYTQYREALTQATPDHLSLREKDRFVWAQSFAQQLEEDLATGFNRTGSE